ncbi:MAG: NADP-dependent isocitrate dehydrogenase [Alphaproteobacteria bacterium]|nr:NADP-dependent isocitrate dehydrogenase [Alphaproteobacteria bacterium]
MSGKTHNITLIPGDGIGPEVTSATCKIIEAAGVEIKWDVCEAGAEVFKKGLETGVPKETIDSILKNKIALKGPLETPVGFGEKSANVTLRKMFETYGNIRPIKEIPGVKTPYHGRGIDLVIVRENIEDLYAGIEHMQTPNVAQCLKLISRKGCEKIVRLAFEFARSEGRKMVHCATKANIMKLSEGLLKRTFEEISGDYPDIEAHHIIVDNCAHQLVKKPEQFDVIVTTNMNGDILSDLGSALIGGLGFAPGANIGDDFAIFEAVHGSAPKYAGKNVINPTAVLLSGVMMLRYLGEFKAAESIEQALYVTLAKDHVLTRDVVGEKGAASTTAFTDAIIKNLGKSFKDQKPHTYKPIQLPKVSKDPGPIKPKNRGIKGIDVFIELDKPFEVLGKNLEQITHSTPFQFKILSCRGVKIYPNLSLKEPDLVDHVCARFVANNETTDEMILDLLQKLSKECHWVHLEKLNIFDGKVAYSKTHGE